MPDLITITGIVATAPRHIVTSSGLDIASFRLASSQRRYDRAQGKWVDADTNWYTVTAFRALAQNVVASLESGQHVLVTGRLRVRQWESGERSGTAVELEAEAVGHDFTWGTGVFTKVLPPTSPTVDGHGDGSFPEGTEHTEQSGQHGHSGRPGDAGGLLGAEEEKGEPALLPF
jgi:single-strand DNA-binding protein